MLPRLPRFSVTLVAFLLSVSALFGKTIVTGSISAADADEVSIQIYEKYLNNTFKDYKITVVNRQFRIDNLAINEPRFVTLLYKGKKANFFITPNDSLVLTIDSGSFPEAESLTFAGRGAKNNEAWAAYSEIFGEDPFSTMYKNVNKGIFSYSLENSLATQMTLQSPAQFVTALDIADHVVLMG